MLSVNSEEYVIHFLHCDIYVFNRLNDAKLDNYYVFIPLNKPFSTYDEHCLSALIINKTASHIKRRALKEDSKTCIINNIFTKFDDIDRTLKTNIS